MSTAVPLALLIHRSSINLGDEIQQIAVRQLLHRYLPERHIEYYLDRDTGVLYDSATLEPVKPITPQRKVAIVYSGWWDGAYTDNFPPNPDVVSHWLILSLHVNELPKDSTYAWLDGVHTLPGKKKSLLAPERFHLLKERFIGCRDPYTVSLFHKQGYSRAYLSRCLTMTLGTVYPMTPYPLRSCERRGVYLVDVSENSNLLREMPEYLRRQIITLSHVWEGDRTNIHAKNNRALELLHLYAHATLVITSRLHCALPCLSYGTPVLFLYHNMSDPRFTGLLDSVSVIGRDSIHWNDLSVHTLTPHDWHLKVRSMIETVKEWTQSL